MAEPPNENSARYKKIIQIKYSKAKTIETALKEVFRDLLSSNDKAFQDQQRGDDDRGGSRRMFGFGFGFGDDDDDDGLGSGTNFKGKLSFGVDETTNILIVTAQGKRLLETVEEMVDRLDQAAVPSDNTRVESLPPGLSSSSVRSTLAKMFGARELQNKPGQQPPQGEGGEDQNGNGEGRGREFRGK